MPSLVTSRVRIFLPVAAAAVALMSACSAAPTSPRPIATPPPPDRSDAAAKRTARDRLARRKQSAR